ncbi:hypothetical protein [Streptomyces sp. HPF1205]|uniref:hypothetical protein n=1 Tax=Streptomyces sp. HPF1205 TaxID=2873262 RepID=UPI001CEC5553|nr:hypothetical protein [Streptomyces sp. HPF1205]
MKRPGTRVRALRAEWTKLVTVPGQLWTLAAVAALMTGVGALAGAAQDPPRCPPHAPCPGPDTTALTLSGVYLAQLAAVMVAVALVSAEYPRMMRVTLAAHPGRTGVLAAKAAVTLAAVLAAGAAGVAGALLAGRAALTARGFTAASGHPAAALTDPALQRAALGTLLYLLLVTLLGTGLAAVVRHQAAAAGTVTGLLYGPYALTLAVPMSGRVLHDVQKVSPMTAGLAVQATPPGTGTAPLGPWTGLAVLAAYAAVALAAGWVLLRRRDA